MSRKSVKPDRHITPRKPISLGIEWHELLERIKRKTGRNMGTEAQMAIYQRAKLLGIDKLPDAPFEDMQT